MNKLLITILFLAVLITGIGLVSANNWCNNADVNRDGKVNISCPIVQVDVGGDILNVSDCSNLALVGYEYKIWKENYNALGNPACTSPGWCNNADINKDSKVDGGDLAILQQESGKTNCASGKSCSDADISSSTSGISDGKVNVYDLLKVSQCIGKVVSGDCEIADTNKDGTISESDKDVVREFYLQECPEEEPVATCTDSDGGLNQNIYGWINFKAGSFESKHEDACALVLSYDSNGLPGGWQSATSCSGKDCYVEEAFCRKDASGNFIDADADQLIKCPNGCKDGACLKESMPTDMDTCLDNTNYYWDQKTDSCLNYYPGCTDPDGGKDIFVNAHTFGLRSSYANSRDKRIITGGKDACISDKQLVEHYCDESGFIQTAYIDCPNGCDKEKGECIKGEQIKEQVTCIFQNSNQEQKCYTSGENDRAYCSGKETCVAEMLGYAGEQITWKSTCGQYQYTTQDGNNEVIYFKCASGETNITQILNNGFRFMYAQCYDGAEEKQGDATSCKSSEVWQKYAQVFCEGHCYKDNSKCGVNSFAVSGECYLGEGLCKEGESTNGCCERWAQENNIITPACVGGWNIENDKCSWSCKDYGECKVDADCEGKIACSCAEGSICESKCIEGKCSCQGNIGPILVCKDSCPLDGKCYDFGYRKSGKYCSDSGGFVPQLEADSTCDNNFECSSNVCVSGKCISENLIQKILNWFKRLFDGE